MRQERTPTYYCSKHERLLGWKYKEWIDFSLATITRIKALYEFFQSAHMEPHFYEVMETRCDKCAELDRQILCEEVEKLDPS